MEVVFERDYVLLFVNILISYFLQWSVMKIYNIATTIDNRIRSFFTVKIAYTLVRYCMFISLLILLLNQGSKLPQAIGGRIINDSTEIFNFVSLLLSTATIVIIACVVYYLFNDTIRKNLTEKNYIKVSQIRGFKSYVSTTLLFTLIVAVMLHLSQYLISSIHKWFAIRQMTLRDWLFINDNIAEDYKKGIFFSLLVSVIITFFTLTAFYKTRHSGNHNNNIRYFLLSIIICVGLFSGIYSIANGYYNYISHDSFMDWYKQDKLLGIFAYRLSSIILLYHLSAFIIKYVLKDNLFSSVLASIIPKYESRSRLNILSDKEYSTTFLPQIGFYILNLSIAEISIVIQEHNIFRDIIGFALFFIIDDYVIIHDYSKKLGHILYWHMFRIRLFNIILFIGGILILLSLKLYFILLLYVLVSFLLVWLYSSNIRTPKGVT